MTSGKKKTGGRTLMSKLTVVDALAFLAATRM